MSLRRDYLVLALLLILGTGAILVATMLVSAQDRPHSDHAKHLQREAMVRTCQTA